MNPKIIFLLVFISLVTIAETENDGKYPANCGISCAYVEPFKKLKADAEKRLKENQGPFGAVLQAFLGGLDTIITTVTGLLDTVIIMLIGRPAHNTESFWEEYFAFLYWEDFYNRLNATING
ncbi:hypothetical protein CAEBREN_04505 [Caenorhabditis brenneri]|uniref:Uncharacterized protein n=1 Tax=Caenorhabditis brenneri TaxID=135651 RepID=G0MC81_CAEBE|nr:hypothetical protein CAEBREN_04505 [Caenorhabditis brenneri]